MKAVPLNKGRYQDGLAKKRQRRFLARAVGIGLGVVVVLVALGWAVFFSGWFTIRDISASGLVASREAEIRGLISQQLTHRWLGIPTGHNILSFPASRLEGSLKASFPYIESIDINKDFLHGLAIKVAERQPEGIWCFVESCSYYDHQGVLIAAAPRSSGFLMLTINDMREGIRAVEPKFLAAIQMVLIGLSEQEIKVKNITIPAGTFTEFDVVIANGYPIKFSLDSNLPGQLEALKIYRSQHKDPNPPYQYLDLRFDGRVYYK